MNPRTPHHYSRMCKGGNSAYIESLPDHLLLEILLRVSAEDIHENARIVCRRWRRIIDGDGFVYAHLRRTCPGLLIAKFSEENCPPFVTAGERRIQISRLRCKFNFPVLASCNGLILGMEWIDDEYMRYLVDPATKYFIVNPATKRRFDLPRLSAGLGFCKFALAYAVSTMEYKVVAAWCDGSPNSQVLTRCAVLVVGAGKTWKHVPMEQLPDHAKRLFFQTPKVTRGFIHWAEEFDVLSMNVETEAITHTPAPLLAQEDHQGKKRHRYYLSAGKYLSLLISCEDNFSYEAWEMIPENREWRKLVNKIVLKSHKCRLRELSCDYIMPVGWVRYPDVLAFFGNGKGGVYCVTCVIYDLDNDEIESFPSSDPHGIHTVVLHRSSLVWFS